MRLMTAVLAGLLASTACAPSPALIAPVETRAPITFSQLLAGPRTAADERIAYGPDALQFGELWLPRRQGRHPVIVLIHGGCWRADLPGLELMDYMAVASVTPVAAIRAPSGILLRASTICARSPHRTA